MFNCPLTGQLCNEERTFVISETIGQFTQTTACCRRCSAQYVHQRNLVAANQAVQLQAHQSATTVQKLVVLPEQIQDVANLSEFLEQILGLESQNGKYLVEKVSLQNIDENKQCGKCGSTVGDIIKSAKFGCAECYKVFNQQILNGIGNSQNGASQHVGKSPKNKHESKATPNQAEVIPLDMEDHVNFLKDQMKQLILEEKYEKAAQCRDLIVNLGGNPKVIEHKNG